ncbi:MAG: HDIG domain-containing protein [Clostridiales bacterium]|nr:HDIG domain-containing protein [Clostridiales bacterium]
MKYKRSKIEDYFSDRIKKLFIFIITYIILFGICSISIIPKKYSLKEGDIAPIDIKAPRDFEDEEATFQKINKAISEIMPKYNKDMNIQKESVQDVEELINLIKSEKKLTKEENEKIVYIKSSTKIKISEEDIKQLIKLNDQDLDNLSEFISFTLTKVLSQDIREDNLDDLKKAQQDLDFYIKSSTLSKGMKDLAYTISFALIKPNMFYDEQKTEELKQQVRKQIEPIIIKKNQNIILKGEVVNAHHLYLMSKAGILEQNKKYDLIIYSGVSILVFLTIVILLLLINQINRELLKSINNDIILSILLILTAILIFSLKLISPYLIPASFLAVLSTLIFGTSIGLRISLVNTLLVICITNFNIEIAIMYIVSSIMGAYFTTKINERNNILFGGLITGFINFLVVYAIKLLNNTINLQTLTYSLIVLLSGLISAILSIGVLPFFEQVFDILTPVKLLELSNPNQVLLKKLLFEAPGTYHHSILVGNLAEAASNEIGANALLARVGSYYHDIGKIKRPYFFKENQITNDNPHDKVTPKLSVSIITSHIKDGIELAEKHKLPREIKDIIQQHHGTTLVKYFYVQAINGGQEEVIEENFRYDGPKPNTKESAIIMLADSVEAAVRSLNNPTVEDITNAVDKIIYDKLFDKQLSDAPLTFNDIEKVKDAFIKVLMGIFHTRIEYPEIEKEDNK